MKKRKPVTPRSQLEAWERWAARNPETVQANKNAWFKSEKGRAWLAANQERRNKARDAWRKRKKAEAEKASRAIK
jgi:hypothetical protein